MICPNCQKTETSITSSRTIKNGRVIERKRFCQECGSFQTQEIAKKSIKKRKVENRTLWQNWRFSMYARTRIADCFVPIVNNTKKYDKIHVFKKNKKLKLEWIEIKNNKFRKKTLNLPPRKFTIQQICTWPDSGYWEKKSELVKNSQVKDREIDDVVRREINEFYRSVVKYIGNAQYNREYLAGCFKKHPNVGKAILNDDRFWNFWLKVR